jgi:hypothetical protein
MPIEQVPSAPPPRAQRMLTTLEKRFSAVRLLRFQALGEKTTPRVALNGAELLPVIFSRTEVQRALGGKAFEQHPVLLGNPVLLFHNRYELVGKLCSVAATGGVYAEALDLVGERLLQAGFDLANYLTPEEDEYNTMWYCSGAWCSWFGDAVCDHSFVFVHNKDVRRFTMLLITCND